MLGRKITTQIALFVVVALVGVTVIAVKYIRLPALLGASGYTVVLDLPDTGGAYTGAEVSYRGVEVGRVGDMRLTRDGAEADLNIRGDAPRIPQDLVASVADRSVVGEQFVDLRPKSDAAPYLGAGSHVTVDAANLPTPVTTLLNDSNAFITSVPRDDLRTVVDELSDATKGSGDDLQALLEASQSFTDAASKNFRSTSDLIHNSDTVLATQQRSAGDIRSFSSSLSLVASTLQSTDGDLRALITTAPGAAGQFQGLINDVGVPLGVLLTNLTTTAQVFSANADGLQGIYVRIPQAVSVGYSVIGDDGLKTGLVTSFFDPLPCVNGYGGTQVRLPSDIGKGQALNTGASCVPTSSGSDVRGSVAAAAASATRTPARTASTSTDFTVASSLADLMGGGS